MRLPHAPVHGQRTLETAQMMVPGRCSRQRVSRIGGAMFGSQTVVDVVKNVDDQRPLRRSQAAVRPRSSRLLNAL